MSSEDTEHLLVTLDTADQHQSLSGRPAAEAEAAMCCGVVIPVKFLTVRIFLVKLFG